MRTRNIVVEPETGSQVIDYGVEFRDDLVISEIRKLTFDFMRYNKFDVINNTSIERLMSYHAFLDKKLQQLIQLRDSLKLTPNKGHMVDVARLVDQLTMADSLNSYSNEKIVDVLKREVMSNIEIITLYTGIIGDMMDMAVKQFLNPN